MVPLPDLRLDDFADLVVLAAAIATGGAALLAIAAAIRSTYRRTLGRRGDRYARLARLGTGAQLSFFVSVLGEPPAMRESREVDIEEYDERGREVAVRKRFIVCYFIDRDYYVQAICNPEETVRAFSVTTRSRRFNPTFSGLPEPGLRARRRWKRLAGRPYRSLFRVRLGKTHFTGLEIEHMSPSYRADLGARLFNYSEAYYFGNPGHYQHYVFTAGNAGYHRKLEAAADVAQLIGRQWTSGPEASDRQAVATVQRFRRATPVTTYTVIGPSLNHEQFPTTFGPHGDEVRTLP